MHLQADVGDFLLACLQHVSLVFRARRCQDMHAQLLAMLTDERMESDQECC